MDNADEFALPGDEARLAQITPVEETAPAEQPVAMAEPEAVAEDAPAVDDRPRNPDGTFAAKPAEADLAAEETPAERLLAGNFKTADELERAYEELRSLNGRQGQELGDLRRTFEQQFAQINEQLQRQPQAPPVQITSDLIDTNPAYAAQLAYEQENGTAFQLAFSAWKDEDPFGASAWAGAKQTETQIAELNAKYEERLSAVQAQIAPVTQTAQAARIAALVAQTPGLAEFVASDKIATVAQEFPEVAAALLSGTPDQKVRSLQTLHQIARGRESDNLQVTQQDIARQQAEQAQAVREEAFVASASTTSAGVKPSVADQIAADWGADKALIEAGWNV